MFTSICDALCESDCLEGVTVCGTSVEDTQTERAVDYFAEALVNENKNKNRPYYDGKDVPCSLTPNCHKRLKCVFSQKSEHKCGNTNCGARSHSCL